MLSNFCDVRGRSFALSSRVFSFCVIIYVLPVSAALIPESRPDERLQYGSTCSSPPGARLLFTRQSFDGALISVKNVKVWFPSLSRENTQIESFSPRCFRNDSSRLPAHPKFMSSCHMLFVKVRAGEKSFAGVN